MSPMNSTVNSSTSLVYRKVFCGIGILLNSMSAGQIVTVKSLASPLRCRTSLDRRLLPVSSYPHFTYNSYRFELLASTRAMISASFSISSGFLRKADTPARHASRSQSVAESMMMGVRLRCAICRARLTSSSPLMRGRS